MLRKEFNGDEGCFRCVKITLIVLHSLALIGLGLLLIIFLVALFGSTTDKMDQEEKKEIRTVGAFAGIFICLMFVLEAIVLFGIIRENKNIVIAALVLSALGVIGNIIQYGFGYGFLNLLMVALTGYYAYMIVKKDRNVV